MGCLMFDDARAIVAEAHRMLRLGGLLGLTSGTTPFSAGTRAVSWALSLVHSLSPVLVGGCRAVELLDLVSDGKWKLRHSLRLSAFSIPMESIVAERL